MPRTTTRLPRKYTEAEFTRQVVDYARLMGWLCAHFRPAINRSGKWSTAMQGDVGFPDLILVRGHLVFAVELKVGKNKTTDSQNRWLDAFHEAGLCVRIWRPEDWSEIERILAR